MNVICGISPMECTQSPDVCLGSGVVIAKNAIVTCSHNVPTDISRMGAFFTTRGSSKFIKARKAVVSGSMPKSVKENLCREVLAVVFLSEDVPVWIDVAEAAGESIKLPSQATFRRMSKEDVRRGWQEAEPTECLLSAVNDIPTCEDALVTRDSMILAHSNGNSGGGYFIDGHLAAIHVGASGKKSLGYVSKRISTTWLKATLEEENA